jgi:hypothetical protein
MRPTGTFAKAFPSPLRAACRAARNRLVTLATAVLLSACGGSPSEVAPPVISTQPADVAVVAGAAAIFSVDASGTQPLSYSWQVSSDGGTNWVGLVDPGPVLTIVQAQLSQNGFRYRVAVSNGAGFAMSSSAVLSVSEAGVAPAIVEQPSDRQVLSGQPGVFAVTASGVPTPSFRWESSADGGITWQRAQGETGADDPVLVTPPTTTADNGLKYRVGLSNASGQVTSRAVTLTVAPAPSLPTFTKQPQATTALIGSQASFSAEAVATPAPGYQWQFSTNAGNSWANVAGGSGGTGPTYVTPVLEADADGRLYRVLAANASGTVTSGTAFLSVAPGPKAPVFTQQPESTTVTAGESALFSAAATGVPAPGYQWESSVNGMDWVTIVGATLPVYVTPATTTSGNGTRYRVRARNGVGGEVPSAPAELRVQAAPALPAFTLQPQPESALVGATATFSTLAVGNPSPDYQWQVSSDDGMSWAAIAGATSPSFTTASLSSSDDGLRFRAVATNASGSATSGTALLGVTPAPAPPVILFEPADAKVLAGQRASFSVAAAGVPTPAYRWQRRASVSSPWMDVTGATSSTLTTEPVRAGDNGAQFRAIASNGQSPDALSQPATLTVDVGYTVQLETSAGSGVFDTIATHVRPFVFSGLTLSQIYNYEDWSDSYGGPLSGFLRPDTGTLALVQGSDGFGLLLVYNRVDRSRLNTGSTHLWMEILLTGSEPVPVVIDDSGPGFDDSEIPIITAQGGGTYLVQWQHGWNISWTDGGVLKISPLTSFEAKFTWFNTGVLQLSGWQFIAPELSGGSVATNHSLGSPQLNRRVRVTPVLGPP